MRWLALAVCLACAAAPAGRAQELAQIQTLRDGADGLGGAWSVAVSPDGGNVYVVSRYDDAVAMFQRDGIGILHYLGKVADGVDGVDGLDSPTDVAVSPDGIRVYVTSDGDDAVAIFDRDLGTGLLTFIAALRDDDVAVTALRDPSAVAVVQSGDQAGRVFVTSFTDGALHAFEPWSGGLSQVGLWIDGVDDVDGLAGARDVVAVDAADGVSVYVASQFDSAVAVFTTVMELFTPVFAQRQVLRDGESGMDGLAFAQAAVAHPSGDRFYVAGGGDDAIAIFFRDPGTGLLTWDAMVQNGAGGVTGIDGLDALAMAESDLYASGGIYLLTNWIPEVTWFRAGFGSDLTFTDLLSLPTILGPAIDKKAIAATPDDAQVLVTDAFQSTLHLYDRSSATGDLTYVQDVADGNGVIGTAGAQSVVVSPDGANVYVLGETEALVTELARDPATGALSFAGVSRPPNYFVPITPPYRSQTLSPDGKNLYVFSYRGRRITVYRRDVVPGRLFEVQSVFSDTDAGRFLQFDAGSVSPDGTRLFVISGAQDAVSIFARSPASGQLTHVATRDESEFGVGMDFPDAVLAASSEEIVVGGSTNVTAPIQLRFGSDGTYLGATTNVSGGELCNGISLAFDATRSTLVTGEHGNHVCVFERSPGGSLTYRGAGYVPSVSGPISSVAFSPNGTRIYAALYDGLPPAASHSTLAVFGMDPTTRAVALLDTLSDLDAGVDDTQGLISVAASPDGRHVYGASFVDDAVVAFAPEPGALGAALAVIAVLGLRRSARVSACRS
jgi:6-phosphogluconolactonase (cycloisomerase 2 family)